MSAHAAAGGGKLCPNCGSRNIEQHEASGASVCTECGVVTEENAIVSSVDFVEGAGGSSAMVGTFVSASGGSGGSRAYSSGGGRGGRGGGRFGFSRGSREMTLSNARRRIQEIASRLRLGYHFIDSAHRMYVIALERGFVFGRRTMHVVASCLYIACRQEKTQHMLIDFSDALQVNVYRLGTTFLKFRRLLGLKLEIIDPALYVFRFTAHLDLDEKANTVAMTALRLIGQMKRDWIVAGRRPAGVCAAALLIASRAHGFDRSPIDVMRILRVCGMTVANRVSEFQRTCAANLTLEKFHEENITEEADPPSFTRNKLIEARARAIQENNVRLLESGALDDPLNPVAEESRRSDRALVRWRKKTAKKTKLEIEFQKLYKSLMKQMSQQQVPIPGQIDEMMLDDSDDDEEEEEDGKLHAKTAEMTDPIDPAEDGTPKEETSTPETIDSDKANENQEKTANIVTQESQDLASACLELSQETQPEEETQPKEEVEPEEETQPEEEGEHEQEIEPGQETQPETEQISEPTTKSKRRRKAKPKNSAKQPETEDTATNEDTGDDNISAAGTVGTELSMTSRELVVAGNAQLSAELSRIYPKGNNGRALILPDFATEEELQPAVVPPEGKLDLKAWKDTMPEEAMEDIDALFRGPEEMAEREAIFNKMNKDFIETQAAKARAKESVEKSKGDKEQEQEEIDETYERYRKRKYERRKANGDETTEEALMSVVANRKSSRKINYDAMSSIFDDDGTFSTAGAVDLEKPDDSMVLI